MIGLTSTACIPCLDDGLRIPDLDQTQSIFSTAYDQRGMGNVANLTDH